MKSGRTFLYLSLAAGAATWIVHGLFDALLAHGTATLASRTFLSAAQQLLGPDPEEIAERTFTFLVFVVFGVLVSGLVERRLDADEGRDRAIEELRKSNRDLEEFARTAAHDLQEPLVSIGGHVARARRRTAGVIDSDSDACLRRALEGVDRMQALVRDLLDYARTGASAAEPRDVSADDVLDRALQGLSESIVRTEAAVTRGPLPDVHADPARLALVFQNLVGNALKYRGTDPPRIYVSSHRRDRSVVFSVSDNGIGIDPAHAEAVFDPFRRVRDDGAIPGTGMGLAICRKIVERHGGSIWLTSTPGEGTTFYFSVPDGPAPRRGRRDPRPA